ncbi:MAG: hypothetical protein NVSMB52_01760 [Chloroflexota bacterium]
MNDDTSKATHLAAKLAEIETLEDLEASLGALRPEEEDWITSLSLPTPSQAELDAVDSDVVQRLIDRTLARISGPSGAVTITELFTELEGIKLAQILSHPDIDENAEKVTRGLANRWRRKQLTETMG